MGGSHIGVHITDIPQGRDLGVQSSAIVHVVAESIVRARGAGLWGTAEYIDRGNRWGEK